MAGIHTKPLDFGKKASKPRTGNSRRSNEKFAMLYRGITCVTFVTFPVGRNGKIISSKPVRVTNTPPKIGKTSQFSTGTAHGE